MDPFIGQVELFSFDFAPMDWMFCDGSLLNISSNDVLFSLLGTTYGGNGTTNFGIPNLKGLEPFPGTGYYIATSGIYPTRD